MQRRSVFLRKTRKGKILKMVREHYLRDDLGCGSLGCRECDQSKQPAKLKTGKRCIIVDTNVVLHQMDVLEAAGDAFDNLICLQTMLREVEHRNRKVYHRLRKLIAEKESWYVFCNEHHRSTYIERLPQESPNDRNDRAIRVAARWYTQHSDETANVLLLTNDADNKAKASKEKLECLTLKEYVDVKAQQDSGLYGHLKEVLANTEEDSTKNELGFTKHLVASELKAGLDTGKIKKGTFTVNRSYWAEAVVKVKGKEIFIPGGRYYSNRAIDGDSVGVQLLPESQWKSPSRRLAPKADEDDICEVKGDAVPTGRVVGIFERRWRPYCGSFEETEKTQGSVLFLSVNARVPKIKVESRQIAALMDKRIMVAIDSWPMSSIYPLGHYVRTLGVIGDQDVETEVVLIEHDVPTAPWTVNVLKCLPPPDYSIPEEEIAKRHDLRTSHQILSIDPPGCTDIDDALHCKVLPNGNFEVGVHIADVTHFMRPATALDDEAAHRSTSVYLVQRRIDMIPTLLSTNLCSLHEKVDRLAFSVVWEMTPKAEIVKSTFFKSVIKSCGAFTYGQAQERLDQGLTDPVTSSIRNLNELAKILKQKRLDAGALSLASTEIKFILNKETQQPEDVAMYVTKQVNSLVEEFMLLANVSVAKKVLSHYSRFSILRRHPTPKPENFVPLLKAAKLLGFDLKCGTSKELADGLDACVVEGKPFFNKLIRILATRSMTQAVYFSSGDMAPADYVHYGLASPVYTHFTSPIRRYADVLVHRLLASCLGIDPLPAACEDKTRTHDTCEVINHRHRMAQLASRASAEVFTLVFFKDKNVIEEGMITAVKSNGISVVVPKYGIENRIVLWRDSAAEEGKAPAVNPYTYDEDKLTLSGNGQTFRMFDSVKVRIYVHTSKMRRQWLVMEVADQPDSTMTDDVKAEAPKAAAANKSANIKRKNTKPSTKKKKKKQK